MLSHWDAENLQLEFSRGSLDLFRCCEEVFERIIEEGAWPCNLPPSAYAQYFT